MSQKLEGKVAVVTGASKGIGASIAKELAAEGAAVVVNYSSSQAAAEEVVKQIEASGGKAVAIGANVSEPEQIAKLFAETISAFGKLDVLVNNAGIYEFAPCEEITPDHFHKQFNLNVLGLLLCCQEAAKRFGDDGGTIVNLSSVVTTYAPPGSAVYSGTKAAVEAATKALSKELGPRGIRINCVNPGIVETEGTHGAGLMGSDFESQIVSQTPLGRVGQPRDIATAVVFLASDDSAWMTGETLVIAGGLR